MEILAAEVTMRTAFDTTGQATQPVAIHEVSADWVAPEATWNQRRTGVSWATPGGAFNPQAESTVANATGPINFHRWSVTPAVRSWYHDSKPNNGFILKFVNDYAVTPTIGFDSHQSAVQAAKPYLSVYWLPTTAIRSPYSYQSFSLGERREAMVNLANGNLGLKELDMSLSGTGLDATVQRSYASGDYYKRSVGARWAMWPQSSEGLALVNNGDVWWHGAPEFYLYFTKNPDGSFRSPHGYRATMALAGGIYTLTMHETGLKYLFDSAGYPKEIVDQNNNKITFSYIWDAARARYQMSSMTDTKGRVTTFERIGPNQVSKITDPAGRTHRYEYQDASGDPQLVRYIDPAGKTTHYEYVSDVAATQYVPPISKITDPGGVVTSFGYTDFTKTPPSFANLAKPVLKLTRVTRHDPNAPNGAYSWNFNYSLPGQTKVTDPNNHTTTHFYDSLGRVTKVTDHLGKSTETSYGANGFAQWVIDPAGAKTNFGYDPKNNPERTTAPSGAEERAFYLDPVQAYYPSKATNAQGNSMAFEYDQGNTKMRQSDLPANGTLIAEYNGNGTVKMTKDGMGNITTFDYFANGDLQRVNKPLGVGSVSYEYDSISRVTKTTDAKGQITEYFYDALDRVTQTKFAGGSSIVNSYDDAGRLIRRDDKSGTGLLEQVQTTTFGYDKLNRQTTKVVGGTTFTSVFDGVGNLKSINDPTTGTVSYSYCDDQCVPITVLI